MKSNANIFRASALASALFFLAGCAAPKDLPLSIAQTDSSLNKADAYADAAYRQSHEGPVKKLIELARSNIADGISGTWETAKAFVIEHKARQTAETALRALEAKPYVVAGRFCERAWHRFLWALGIFISVGGTLFVLQFIWPPIFAPLFKLWLGIVRFILDLLPKILHRIVEYFRGPKEPPQ